MAEVALITSNIGELAAALPDGGKLLGLDVGTRTIGLAVCDAGWHFAGPAETIRRTKFTKGTTRLAGGITIPIIPGIGKETGETSGGLHEVLVYTTIALLLLHVAAAIQQQFFEHDRTAGRMPPFQAPGGEQAVIGQG